MAREIKFRVWAKMAGGGYKMFYNITDIETENTLMQFTGLKDKNGKEIYEGDVIKIKDEGNSESAGVYWEDKSTMFQAKSNTDKYMLFKIDELNFEVIDNIYENPELIK